MWVLCFTNQPFPKFIVSIKLPTFSGPPSQTIKWPLTFCQPLQTYLTIATFGKIRRFLQLFRGPSSQDNIFARNISSTTLTKFRQNLQFRQIRQRFLGPSC